VPKLPNLFKMEELVLAASLTELAYVLQSFSRGDWAKELFHQAMRELQIGPLCL